MNGVLLLVNCGYDTCGLAWCGNCVWGSCVGFGLQLILGVRCVFVWCFAGLIALGICLILMVLLDLVFCVGLGLVIC